MSLIASPRAVQNAQYLKELDEAFHSYTTTGLQHSKNKQFTEAIDYHYAAMQCAVQLQSVAKENVAVGNLGLTCFRQDDLKNADAYFNRHLSLSVTLMDLKGQYRALKYLGEIASVNGDYPRAAHCFKETVKIAQYMEDEKTAGAARMKVGIALANEKMQKHMISSARKYFRKPESNRRPKSEQKDGTFLTNMEGGSRGATPSRKIRAVTHRARPQSRELAPMAPLSTAR